MITGYVNGIGIVAPGLQDWPSTAAVLNNQTAYVSQAIEIQASSMLPANERRRTTILIKLALQVAEQALSHADVEADKIASVFSSSDGDTEIIHKICTAANLPDQPVSPTQFHNSVHNAAAGYWAIATSSQLPSSSISAGDYSFAAGMVEAASIAQQLQVPVLSANYDIVAPFPLTLQANSRETFACAFLLSAEPNKDSIGKLSFEFQLSDEITLLTGELESLRKSNSAARSLPLLQLLAQQKPGSVVLPAGEGLSLVVDYTHARD